MYYKGQPLSSHIPYADIVASDLPALHISADWDAQSDLRGTRLICSYTVCIWQNNRQVWYLNSLDVVLHFLHDSISFHVTCFDKTLILPLPMFFVLPQS